MSTVNERLVVDQNNIYVLIWSWSWRVISLNPHLAILTSIMTSKAFAAVEAKLDTMQVRLEKTLPDFIIAQHEKLRLEMFRAVNQVLNDIVLGERETRLFCDIPTIAATAATNKCPQYRQEVDARFTQNKQRLHTFLAQLPNGQSDMTMKALVECVQKLQSAVSSHRQNCLNTTRVMETKARENRNIIQKELDKEMEKQKGILSKLATTGLYDVLNVMLKDLLKDIDDDLSTKLNHVSEMREKVYVLRDYVTSAKAVRNTSDGEEYKLMSVLGQLKLVEHRTKLQLERMKAANQSNWARMKAAVAMYVSENSTTIMQHNADMMLLQLQKKETKTSEMFDQKRDDMVNLSDTFQQSCVDQFAALESQVKKAVSELKH